MDRQSLNDLHETPAQNADELARLASEAADPGARVWYLEWAKAFRQLASLNDQQPPAR